MHFSPSRCSQRQFQLELFASNLGCPRCDRQSTPRGWFSKKWGDKVDSMPPDAWDIRENHRKRVSSKPCFYVGDTSKPCLIKGTYCGWASEILHHLIGCLSHWLLVSNMNFIFHFIYGMSSFPLTNSYFSRW